MKFQNTLKLIGVVGKKGAGTLDNGQAWSTDRVELHCLSTFDDTDSMSHGQTVVVHNIENYAENYERAKQLVNRDIIVDFEMVAPKKPGASPKLVARGFHPVAAAKAS